MLEEFDTKVVIFNAKVGKPEDQRAGCAPCAAQIAQESLCSSQMAIKTA